MDLERFVAQAQRFNTETADELAEVQTLISQANAEIERFVPEKNELSRKLREMESGIEHYSQLDLRRMSTLVQEASMRLFMMQSRLEQLEYREKILQRVMEVFRDATVTEQPTTPESVAAQPEVPPDKEARRAVVFARESERREVARHLHEHTAPLFTDIGLRLQTCEQTFGQNLDRAREELQEIRSTVGEHIQATRRLIFDLHPTVLDDLGLVPTLRRYLPLLEQSTAAKLDLTAIGLERRYAPYIEASAYRVIQLAIDNALRHAQAQCIEVSIEDDGNTLLLTVSDNGVGFDVAPALDVARQTHVGGIGAMLDQADTLNATVTIDSDSAHGTRVRMSVSL